MGSHLFFFKAYWYIFLVYTFVIYLQLIINKMILFIKWGGNSKYFITFDLL